MVSAVKNILLKWRREIHKEISFSVQEDDLVLRLKTETVFLCFPLNVTCKNEIPHADQYQLWDNFWVQTT